MWNMIIESSMAQYGLIIRFTRFSISLPLNWDSTYSGTIWRGSNPISAEKLPYVNLESFTQLFRLCSQIPCYCSGYSVTLDNNLKGPIPVCGVLVSLQHFAPFKHAFLFHGNFLWKPHQNKQLSFSGVKNSRFSDFRLSSGTSGLKPTLFQTKIVFKRFLRFTIPGFVSTL